MRRIAASAAPSTRTAVLCSPRAVSIIAALSREYDRHISRRADRTCEGCRALLSLVGNNFLVHLVDRDVPHPDYASFGLLRGFAIFGTVVHDSAATYRAG
jgi:hypothetical protein